MIPGEVYIMKNLEPGNPFKKKRSIVIIMEVRGEWVRYRFKTGFSDNSMKIDRFFDIYEPEGSYKPEPEKPKSEKSKPKRRIEINSGID